MELAHSSGTLVGFCPHSGSRPSTARSEPNFRDGAKCILNIRIHMSTTVQNMVPGWKMRPSQFA